MRRSPLTLAPLEHDRVPGIGGVARNIAVVSASTGDAALQRATLPSLSTSTRVRQSAPESAQLGSLPSVDAAPFSVDVPDATTASTDGGDNAVELAPTMDLPVDRDATEAPDEEERTDSTDVDDVDDGAIEPGGGHAIEPQISVSTATTDDPAAAGVSVAPSRVDRALSPVTRSTRPLTSAPTRRLTTSLGTVSASTAGSPDIPVRRSSVAFAAPAEVPVPPGPTHVADGPPSLSAPDETHGGDGPGTRGATSPSAQRPTVSRSPTDRAVSPRIAVGVTPMADVGVQPTVGATVSSPTGGAASEIDVDGSAARDAGVEVDMDVAHQDASPIVERSADGQMALRPDAGPDPAALSSGEVVPDEPGDSDVEQSAVMSEHGGSPPPTIDARHEPAPMSAVTSDPAMSLPRRDSGAHSVERGVGSFAPIVPAIQRALVETSPDAGSSRTRDAEAPPGALTRASGVDRFVVGESIDEAVPSARPSDELNVGSTAPPAGVPASMPPLPAVSRPAVSRVDVSRRRAPAAPISPPVASVDAGPASSATTSDFARVAVEEAGGLAPVIDAPLPAIDRSIAPLGPPRSSPRPVDSSPVAPGEPVSSASDAPAPPREPSGGLSDLEGLLIARSERSPGADTSARPRAFERGVPVRPPTIQASPADLVDRSLADGGTIAEITVDRSTQSSGTTSSGRSDDVDEIAERVYRKVKQKLRVEMHRERERKGGLLHDF